MQTDGRRKTKGGRSEPRTRYPSHVAASRLVVVEENLSRKKWETRSATPAQSLFEAHEEKLHDGASEAEQLVHVISIKDRRLELEGKPGRSRQQLYSINLDATLTVMTKQKFVTKPPNNTEWVRRPGHRSPLAMLESRAAKSRQAQLLEPIRWFNFLNSLHCCFWTTGTVSYFTLKLVSVHLEVRCARPSSELTTFSFSPFSEVLRMKSPAENMSALCFFLSVVAEGLPIHLPKDSALCFLLLSLVSAQLLLVVCARFSLRARGRQHEPGLLILKMVSLRSQGCNLNHCFIFLQVVFQVHSLKRETLLSP